jgi:hypothetical protein
MEAGLTEWISIAANIGVIAGLILLSVQVRQNTTGLRAAAYQTWLTANMELNVAATDPAQSSALQKGYIDPRSLTADTYIQFAMWNFSLMQMAQVTNHLYQEGSVSRELWRSEMGRAAGILGLPGVRQLWDAGMKSQLTPEFVALIEGTKPTITAWTWDAESGFKSFTGQSGK